MTAQDYIQEALLQLIQQKAYDKITITDIANRAGVTRISFYRNFDSKDAILKQALERAYSAYKKEYGNDLSFPSLFSFFQQNKTLIDCLYKSEKEIFIAQLLTDRQSLAQLPTELAYSYAFVGYSILGACTAWYQRGMVDTAEEITRIMNQQKSS
ncbi:TPA: TetR/AcrR family transcriptional regulator [Streptococcus suis]|uniref:TetR/AcrR family transcriptional regulator n=1 Tax=Streptococcus TaxID=1301 RepID=UPI000404BB86|nr:MULTISPECIES: TetR/AcrR family transcriptional regulator [Streptococcus]AXI67784.1 TetR/AcrR family transcriptional regulator [Streptococcus suis]MBM7192028.1 TetR/AcrR family transcriptional regulator [Streptococcus suis]MBM7284053.1 TetR/AcrR family transcriptional regulator [Streptococcus suis]MBO3642588.1 TetR/AcrR family transcriptional regulator [Streptococcus suis]MBY0718897.1 TetR/AcrR family transcriptional regulator [Streptococcus sp. 2018110]